MSSALTVEAEGYAMHAVKARSDYLQGQVTAWIIINDQYQDVGTPSERAKLIA